MTLDVLSIRHLEVACIVGVFPRERDIPQPLVVDVDLWLDTRASARSETLSATVDYGRVAGELRFLLESSRFRLIETAAEALARWLLLPPATTGPSRPAVARVRVKLTKPEALAGGALASLEIERAAADETFTVEDKAFGAVDVVYVARDCGIYRLRIAPGRAIATHVHRVMDEHELVLTDGILVAAKGRARGRRAPLAEGAPAPLRQPDGRRAEPPVRGPPAVHPRRRDRGRRAGRRPGAARVHQLRPRCRPLSGSES